MTKQSIAAHNIYERNKNLHAAGKLESISGVGSSLSYTKRFQDFLKKIIYIYNIKTISDCPCGDFHWMQHVNLTAVKYTGYDVVEPLVERNRVLFPTTDFVVFDAINNILPPTDLIICRDFLFHLHDEDIHTVLSNFIKSGSRYLMTTSFNDIMENKDYNRKLDYGFRPINLELFPFNISFKRLDSIAEPERNVNLYQIQ
jgi:hypothetical protein